MWLCGNDLCSFGVVRVITHSLVTEPYVGKALYLTAASHQSGLEMCSRTRKNSLGRVVLTAIRRTLVADRALAMLSADILMPAMF